MADTKKQQKQPKSPGQKSEQKQGQQKPKNSTYLYAAIAVVVIAAVLAFLFAGPALNTAVPFSTFKAGFQSAARVSVTATYLNQSQYTALSPCFTSIIQAIAHSRKASTIDFFIIDQSNSTCIYSKTGLGGSVSPTTTNSSYCLHIANSEPGIYLNYSASNYTSITTSRMSVYGNGAYMTSCPIAVELD